MVTLIQLAPLFGFVSPGSCRSDSTEFFHKPRHKKNLQRFKNIKARFYSIVFRQLRHLLNEAKLEM
jgi:hypothetical protein